MYEREWSLACNIFAGSSEIGRAFFDYERASSYGLHTCFEEGDVHALKGIAWRFPEVVEQPSARSSGDIVERTTEESTGAAELLRTALEELREIKEERVRFQQREGELFERLRQIQSQSFINFNFNSAFENNIGFKLQSDIYGGSSPLRKFSFEKHAIVKRIFHLYFRLLIFTILINVLFSFNLQFLDS